MKVEQFLRKELKICVVGLGYVGLPLATILSRKFSVIGFDINKDRINALESGNDSTNEVDSDTLQSSKVHFSADPKVIKQCSLLIVTVPTPVNSFKIPDLSLVISASQTVGRNMRCGSIVVYESTVYPGVTENECVPILEKESGFKHLRDFNVGYSPERVNPGDKDHTLDRIKKVVSGDTDEIRGILCDIYGKVITAGIHPATNIKTAEAAKVIENTQRDLNIALMNELALIFNRMGIDTNDVLDAAATKWNFIRFEPGLVGGHCIGVDPYYLTFAAESLGYRPEVILAGR
ncbi:nucleotide sugar dehydrogenase, partial [bacterium]|nr:nucleotide sugar dehydrogenase [bacterium]